MFKFPAAVSTLLAVVIVASTAGCGGAKNPANAVIDCLVADRARVDTVITDLGTKTRPDGTRDWIAIEADAISAGIAIGGCALAEFVQSYLAPTAGVKAPQDSARARDTLEHFRATHAGHATFKTQFGAL